MKKQNKLATTSLALNTAMAVSAASLGAGLLSTENISSVPQLSTDSGSEKAFLLNKDENDYCYSFKACKFEPVKVLNESPSKEITEIHLELESSS